MRPRHASLPLIGLAFSLLSGGAQAQMTHAGAPSEAAPYGAPVDDQHVWAHAVLDHFELRPAEHDSSFVWDAEAWTGTDTHRAWLKTEGTFANDNVEEGLVEAFYSRPITTYFDLQAGGRYDLDARSGRGWAALGIEGLAPLFFQVFATAYISDAGHFSLRTGGSYDLLITQRLILQPEIEASLYTKADQSRQIGAGLSEIEAGLRLRYEITRKFAPYVGLTYSKQVGRTGRYAQTAGEDTDVLRAVIGIRSWL